MFLLDVKTNPEVANALVQSNPNLWAKTVGDLNQLHAELEEFARKSVEIAIQIGSILTNVRSTLKHGEWLPWVEEFAPFSRYSAERYLWVFTNKEKLRNVRNLSEAYQLKITDGADGSDEPAKLHEPNFHSQAVRLRQNLIGAFNHYIQRRPLRSWQTEEIFDLLSSLKPLTEVCQQLELELSTRDDVPGASR